MVGVVGVVGVGGGSLSGGSRVHITFLLGVLQERLVCTHTKVLVIFIVCCCVHKATCFLCGCHLLLFSFSSHSYRLRAPVLSICVRPREDSAPLHPTPCSLWTEAAGSDVW